MIIRHLILPNHVECCSKPLKMDSRQLGLDVVVNIMSQYRPTYNAFKHQDISVLPTQKELGRLMLMPKV